MRPGSRIEGPLEKLAVAPGEPARYRLALRDEPVADRGGAESAASPRGGLELNPLLGRALSIEFLGRISCAECGTVTAKSYGRGYCYPCFRALARCDLCVVSPARCHFHLGTCREPAWGEAFCMQPHQVYLANSSGPKVGITTARGEITRWLDQGASQGLVIADAPTRHLAGVLEKELTGAVSDRTDWRALLRGPAAPVDLPALRDRLRAWLRDRGAPLPDGVVWRDSGRVVSLDYPVLDYPRQLRRLRLDRHRRIAGTLVGVKGQYLLFEHGVFSVGGHRAFHVRVALQPAGALPRVEPAPAPTDDPIDDSQLELFS
ncbi:MAG: DUF2797 domain-containing protein [Pseudomonadales bacterium]